ncbi:MAG: enolase C-terminal domain-like protein [Pseudomonadales bacterium]
MRIQAIHEISVPLAGNVANAVVSFASHTVSLLALVSDQQRNGRPVCGIAFNSIGRFAQSGILKERMIPRLLDADPATLLDADEKFLAPERVAAVAMQNEKPGGHGDRAHAVAALELATWDLNAKLQDEPACITIARACLQQAPSGDGVEIYAAGGYYYAEDSTTRLREELEAYQQAGFERFKIKIGGAPLAADLRRIETAIEVAGCSTAVAVDANARFSLDQALEYADALAGYDLGWFEEPCDPLDFASLCTLIEAYPGAIATGENLFSAGDSANLIRFGGLRPDCDLLQMDPGLMYGITEYLHMLTDIEANGFNRSACVPHGGHMINLHVVSALGLGGCEAYPGVFQPFGGFAPQCQLGNSRAAPTDAPGFGLEQKPELKPHIDRLLEAC